MKCFNMKNRASKVGILTSSLFFAISLCYDLYIKILYLLGSNSLRTLYSLPSCLKSSIAYGTFKESANCDARFLNVTV